MAKQAFREIAYLPPSPRRDTHELKEGPGITSHSDREPESLPSLPIYATPMERDVGSLGVRRRSRSPRNLSRRGLGLCEEK